MKFNPTWRIAVLALAVFIMDQFTKLIVLRHLSFGEEKIVIDGFFKFVHWGNTGAAWSIFRGNNSILALTALAALIILFLARHHFDVHTLGGQMSLGLIFGGILGNLMDRIRIGHVVDFLRFYVERRGTNDEIGFPAFNIADSAICVGVGLLFILSFQSESPRPAPTSS
jgi:signal peptidase II